MATTKIRPAQLNPLSLTNIDDEGTSAALDVGTTANTVCAGDDSRLTDARTPDGTALASASIWIGDANNLAAEVAVTGAVTITNLGVTTVVTNANLTGGVTSVGNAATVVTNANLTGGVTSVGNAATVVTNANLTGGVTSVGNAATVVTNANLTGDVTSVGNATTLTNAPVIAKVLTGYVSGAGTVAATDSILQAIQKLNGNNATNANLTGGVTSVGNAATVVTNANLTGHITSVGNAAVLGSFTSAQLLAALTDETGTGANVFATSPTLVTPLLGTPTSGVMTNVTGTASGLTAGNVTTNANLTGDVTSVGNATTLTNAPVIAKVLTGYVSGAGTVAATDSILQAIQKLNGNNATNANLTGGVTSVGNAATVVTNANLTGGVTSVGNAATVITNANLTGDITSVGNATTLTNAPVIAKVLTGYVSGAGTVAATDSILAAIQKLNGNNATNANLTGDVTSVGNATTLTNAPVIAKVLTGYVSGAGTVAATDSILQAIQKLNGNNATNANLTGDVTSVGNATTLASVATAGTTGSSTAIPVVTINAKGLTTGITTAAVIAPAGTLTGATLASNVLASSLTSVGTLAAVAITGGTINGATVGATTPATGAFTSLSATGITTVASGTALLPSIVSTTGTADTGLWFPAADTLAASTAGSERIRISSTGNVGIGTTSPGAILQVDGSSASVLFRVKNTTYSGSVRVEGVSAFAAGPAVTISDYTDGSKHKLYVDNSGVFSIRTSDDTLGLTLNTQGRLNAVTFKANGGEYAFAPAFALDLTSGYESGMYLPAANTVGFATTRAERMRIDAAGNVGIGTTAPNRLLTVAGATGLGLGSELLTNNTFTSNITPWSSASYGGGTTSGGSWNASGWADFAWTVGGSNEQIRANEVAIGNASVGDIYVLSFRAKASSNGMQFYGISLSQAGSPYGTNIVASNLALTTAFQQFNYQIVISNAGNPSVQLIFFVQTNTTGTWSLDDVYLKKVGNLYASADGNIGIGTTAPNANAILDVTSTTKAFMPPRMTTTQKNAVASPTSGMVVYDSTLGKLSVYGASAWQTVTSA